VSFGRIHPDKGTADAIEIARRAGRRLVICGIVQDERYFAQAVEPHVDGDQVIFGLVRGRLEIVHVVSFDRVASECLAASQARGDGSRRGARESTGAGRRQ
jgi:glycosyltransferase involved in cell wall biosynthesis